MLRPPRPPRWQASHPLDQRDWIDGQPVDGWPSKTLRIILGYPAGSSPDVQARLLAEPLARALGQAVVVENKPGASGNIGADAIAEADDGHTIGVIGNGHSPAPNFSIPSWPMTRSGTLRPLC